MIPSFVIVKWREGQKFGVPIPIFLFWPLLLLLFVTAGVVQLATLKSNLLAAKVLLGIEGFVQFRGFHLKVKSQDTNLSISVI